jgi:hypothetical protein
MSFLRMLATLGLALASGCEESSCFAGSTMVATPRGQRAIRELAIGDEIWSYDHVTCRFAIGRVTAVHRSSAAIRSIRTVNGVLRAVTDSHPLFVPARSEFVAASAIAVSETLLHWDGDPESPPVKSEVLGAEWPAPGDTVEVFNLTVGGAYSTFFADGFFVHNKSVPPPNCAPPTVHVRATSALCVGENVNIEVLDVYGVCLTNEELRARTVLATSDPSVILVEGWTALGADAGAATITALVDGKPAGKTSLVVTSCDKDAHVDSPEAGFADASFGDADVGD